MVEPIREKVFRRWCNSFLLPVNMCMEDFSLDLKDGVKLCALLEIVSGRSVPGFTKTPDRREQKQNIDALFSFLKNAEFMVDQSISCDAIFNGDIKATCSLIWTLIIEYQIKPLITVQWTSIYEPVKDLVNSKLPPDHQVLNFTSDWKDGAVLTKLSMDHFPSTWNPDELNVLDAAEKYLGVPKVLFYDELQSPDIDEDSVVTYVTLLLAKMTHLSSERHEIIDPTPSVNNLFFKVIAPNSMQVTTNDMENVAKAASSKFPEQSITVAISVVALSSEVVVGSFVEGTVTSLIKVEAEYIGSITAQNIADIISIVFKQIANIYNTRIYFSIILHYLDDNSSPPPRYGWMTPGN